MAEVYGINVGVCVLVGFETKDPKENRLFLQSPCQGSSSLGGSHHDYVLAMQGSQGCADTQQSGELRRLLVQSKVAGGSAATGKPAIHKNMETM